MGYLSLLRSLWIFGGWSYTMVPQSH